MCVPLYLLCYTVTYAIIHLWPCVSIIIQCVAEEEGGGGGDLAPLYSFSWPGWAGGRSGDGLVRAGRQEGRMKPGNPLPATGGAIPIKADCHSLGGLE